MEMADLMKYLLTPAAQVALIMGLAEIVKRLGLNSKLIPVVDLVLGMASGLCVYGIAQEYGIMNGIILGIALGLAACGLFSGIKNVVELWGDDGDG